MTTQPQGGVVPEWTRGERLAKARKLIGMNTKAFAAEIGVSQKTVNNAEADAAVKPITLKMWAFTTGVDLEWLSEGTGVSPTPSPGGGRHGHSDELTELTATKRARHGRNGGDTTFTDRYNKAA